MRFFDLALLCLARRPARSIATVTGISVAFAGFVALVGLSSGMERAFVELFLGRGTHVVAVRKQTVDLLAATVSEQRAEAISRVAGVSEVAAELVGMLNVASGEGVLVSGWPEGCYLWRTLSLRQGRLPAPGSLDEAVVAQLVSEALGKRVGDEVEIGTGTFRIVGEFAAEDVTSNKLILVPLGALQRILGREGKVTLFNIRMARPDDPAEVDAIKNRLSALAPELEFLSTEDIGRNNRPLRLLRAVAWGASAVALFLAVVLVLNTLLMSLAERKSEIGVLTAVGWQTGRVLALIALEGVLLAVAGGVIGAILGAETLRWLAGVPPLRGFLKPAMNVHLAIMVTAASLAIGAVGSALPAWRAARLDAIEALRSK